MRSEMQWRQSGCNPLPTPGATGGTTPGATPFQPPANGGATYTPIPPGRCTPPGAGHTPARMAASAHILAPSERAAVIRIGEYPAAARRAFIRPDRAATAFEHVPRAELARLPRAEADRLERRETIFRVPARPGAFGRRRVDLRPASWTRLSRRERGRPLPVEWLGDRVLAPRPPPPPDARAAMQSLRAYRNPRRAIAIEALLVWTFRAQRAELDPPTDRDRDRPAVGAEWIIFQRGAVLGCTIDCSRRVLSDRVHEDAETVAAVVTGALDWCMATRVAELARAGRRPTCVTGPVRCIAAEWNENQRGRWPVVAPALPGKFPGGVWRPAMKDRKGRDRYEGHCTPVTYDPTPHQVAASRREYMRWWAALHEVRERLLAAPVLRDHELTSAMPPVSFNSEGQDQ